MTAHQVGWVIWAVHTWFALAAVFSFLGVATNRSFGIWTSAELRVLSADPSVARRILRDRAIMAVVVSAAALVTAVGWLDKRYLLVLWAGGAIMWAIGSIFQKLRRPSK